MLDTLTFLLEKLFLLAHFRVSSLLPPPRRERAGRSEEPPPTRLLQRGDLLEVPRTLFTHFGIYLGEGRVAHLIPDVLPLLGAHPKRVHEMVTNTRLVLGVLSKHATVRVDSVEDFAYGAAMLLNAMDRAVGRCALPQEEVAARAEKLVGPVSYSLLWNNCEHFVTYTRYGTAQSLQTDKGCREAVIWMAVHHTQKKALEVFAREVAPAGTGMAPGLTGIVGGRPRVSPVLKPFFFMHPKSELKVEVHVDGQEAESIQEAEPHTSEQEVPPPSAQEEPDAELPSGPHSFRLEELAFTRSGDKGDSANIGVIARHPLFFPYLKKHLTSSVVEDYFSHLITPGTKDAVTRYTLPGINGLNFVLQSSLGGGGVASLRSDPQGKAYGQMLLDLKLRNLPDLKSL
ncbi:hypothetical protein JOQ06_013713, partial [Pogonophryne albipinna]